MHVSMDRFGRVVVAGEGTYRTPVGVGQTDNTLSNPASQAQNLYDQECLEYATMAALGQQQAVAQAANDANCQALQNLADDYEDYVGESAAEANGGEHPLLYAAAMQTMAGNTLEHCDPLNGYMLSEDGQPCFDRGMTGRYPGAGMGQTQSLIQAAQADAAAAQSTVAPLLALAQGASSSAASAPAPAAPPSGLSSLMSQTVGGIPVPYLAAALAAFLVLRK